MSNSLLEFNSFLFYNYFFYYLFILQFVPHNVDQSLIDFLILRTEIYSKRFSIKCPSNWTEYPCYCKLSSTFIFCWNNTAKWKQKSILYFNPCFSGTCILSLSFSIILADWINPLEIYERLWAWIILVGAVLVLV